MTIRAAASSVFVVLALVVVLAQSEGFDPETVALTFHKVSGAPLDTQTLAAQSEAARRASGFDRPDVIAAEQKRLDAQLASMNPAQEFAITIDDSISQYDHTSGQFTVELFNPGTFIPVRVFNREYRIVFANAASARAIPMPRDAAREFDARLNSLGRQVKTEVHFKVVGKGDPVGGVLGDLVVRSEIVSVRVLDRSGQVVFTPKVVATSAMPAFAGFDASKADVAGLRIGVSKKDMEATLTRLFGKVTPGSMSGDGKFKGFTSVIEVNSMGCRSGFSAKKRPQPGAVCVTAYVDGSDVVRMVRVERLFPPGFDGRVFEKALIQKYGPANGSRRGSSWGPGVPGAVLNNPAITVDSLTATPPADHDITDLGGNRLQNVIVTLQLIDATWAKQFGQ
jgi:hypothetical protein